jgi:hypothetical protein
MGQIIPVEQSMGREGTIGVLHIGGLLDLVTEYRNRVIQ